VRPRAVPVTVAVVAALITLVSAALGRERVIHSFQDHPADLPVAGLIFDSAGNLYGTTHFGGDPLCDLGCGTVFKLAPISGGGWSYSVIYSFHGGRDGGGPAGALAIDSAGNLYGTTESGGSNECGGGGCGTVFKLTPSSRGKWAENVLYRFNGTSGELPYAGVVLDAAGNIYGTTIMGGSAGCSGGCGVAFELTRSGSQWNESVLYRFSGGSDGAYPYAPLIFDVQGNLYGTASQGGVGLCGGVTCGVAFELTPSSGGGWTEKVLYSFRGGKDGGSPVGGLSFDSAGNLYGTTYTGGSKVCQHGCGTVFELTQSSGQWTETILHRFQGGKDGANPYSVSLVRDQVGNLYGTTVMGGQSVCNCGTVFKLTPGTDGQWTRRSVYAFDGKHGSFPYAGLVINATGTLYGTAVGGGSSGFGVVFEIMP
jgi:uncharacterized repeat protein (TIGR03803 family)